ncbi:MAG: serine/threonine-protein kinase [Myxococcota bacterium]
MLACPFCGSVYARSQEFCGLDGTRLEEVVEDPLLGRTVGRYIIERPLGSGGMARVYRGRHEVLEERVAVKVLHGELSADKHLAKRFEREARSLSRIQHPNVVEVRDFGRTETGILYMVMELVEGHTLADALRRAGPLPPGEAGRITADIARGLGAAHDTGYVHRDLKPGNVVLDVRSSPSAVKILDFGLVGLVEGTESDTPLTRQGTFFGTPTYMSPEQSAGERAQPASDMYALGVVLYELLTGTPPFFGDIRQLAQQHMQSEPPRPPLEYGGLTGLALELLSKVPEDRPTSDELVDAICALPLTLPPTVAADVAPPRRRSSAARPRLRPRLDPDPTPVDPAPMDPMAAVIRPASPGGSGPARRRASASVWPSTSSITM